LASSFISIPRNCRSRPDVTAMRSFCTTLALILLAAGGVWAETPQTSPNSQNPQWDELTEHSQANSWPFLSASRATAIRTQRDISANVSVAYHVVPGIDTRTVLFESSGYNETSLENLRTLLNVGVQTIILDLYYYEKNSQWLLCPPEEIYDQGLNRTVKDYCDSSNFNLTSIVSTLNGFLTATNNNLNTNVFFLLLKLNQFSVPYSNITLPQNAITSNITSLSASLATISKVVSPLSIDNNQLPTLDNLLFKLGLRVFPIIVANELPKNTTYRFADDKFTLFTSPTAIRGISSDPSIVEEFNMIDMEFMGIDSENSTCSKTADSKLSFTFDSEETPYTMAEYRRSISCAQSPIISHKFLNLSDISSFLEYSSWSWSAYQPTLTDIDELQFVSLIENLTDYEGLDTRADFNGNQKFISTATYGVTSKTHFAASDGDDDDDEYNDEYVNRCAVLSKLGWIATACDRKLIYFCQNQENSSDIIVSQETLSYGSAHAACSTLNGHYSLAVPRNVMDQQYLISLLPDKRRFAWIDLNSLSSSNCWVVGPTTNCPYQNVVSTHIFVKLITPSSTMAGLLIILLIWLQFHRLPVHKNRKSWKRKINEMLKNEYEGVPS
jgi:hypothetical protein